MHEAIDTDTYQMWMNTILLLHCVF